MFLERRKRNQEFGSKLVMLGSKREKFEEIINTWIKKRKDKRKPVQNFDAKRLALLRKERFFWFRLYMQQIRKLQDIIKPYFCSINKKFNYQRVKTKTEQFKVSLSW